MRKKIFILVAVLAAYVHSVQAATFEEFFVEPKCYFETKDSDILGLDGLPFRDEILIQLIYLPRSQALIGVFNNLPADVDQTTGVIEVYVDSVESASDGGYHLKALYHASSEGEQTTYEYYFLANESEIKIGVGARVPNEYGGIYVYEKPDEVTYSRPIPRTDCD